MGEALRGDPDLTGGDLQSLTLLATEELGQVRQVGHELLGAGRQQLLAGGLVATPGPEGLVRSGDAPIDLLGRGDRGATDLLEGGWIGGDEFRRGSHDGFLSKNWVGMYCRGRPD